MKEIRKSDRGVFIIDTASSKINEEDTKERKKGSIDIQEERIGYRQTVRDISRRQTKIEIYRERKERGNKKEDKKLWWVGYKI